MRHTSLLVASSIGIMLPACDRPGDAATDGGIVAPAVVASARSDWGPAVRVDGSILLNTTALEGCPIESPDGRSLYFASNRDNDLDIWVSQRGPDGAWGEPEQLPKGVNSVNSTAGDFCPTPLPGGRLLFVSERADDQNCGPGTADIYEARLHPALGWLPPEHLGCVINSPAAEFSPSYVPAGGGMLFFSSSRGNDGKHAIYVSVRSAGGEWQTPEPVAELNAAGFNTFRPNVSPDGREIVFDSDRPTSQGFDIWTSRRATPHGEWAAPVKLSSNGASPINTSANESRPSLSRDGKRLYFGSTRVAGQSSDIFVAERH